MISCRQARETMLAHVRRQASEAERLRLEEHLAQCAACSEERAQAGLLEVLRDAPSPTLSGEARARVLRSLTSLPVRQAFTWQRPRFRRQGLLALVAAAAIVFIVGVWPWGGWAPEDKPPAVASQALPSAAPQLQQETALHARAPGVAEIAGAQVRYQADTAMRLHPAARRIDLLNGEIEVKVESRGGEHFRVKAPGFVVEVTGTHFVVRLDGVRTLEGTVRVLDESDHQIAVVRAGESWHVTGGWMAAAPAPDKPAAAPRREAPPSIKRSSPSLPERASAPTSAPELTAGQLLDEARGILSRGDTAKARQRIALALECGPTPRQRAVAELLGADALLVESRRDLALAAYRRAADEFAAFPEGETASFVAAQLLFERGSRAQARVALEIYLERYPDGRFVREARERLAACSVR